jgi:hypothetical protein
MQNARGAWRLVLSVNLALCILTCALPVRASAQQLLDRVLARVNGEAITKTDLDAAKALGLITVAPGEKNPDDAALQQLIDRQLLLEEVARFPPPEPAPTAIDQEVQRLTMHASMPLADLQRTTGVDSPRLRGIARDSLRIRAYLDQRFGTSGEVTSNEVRDYYRSHLTEFQKNGQTIPFEDAEPAARERAAASRRTQTIDQWLREVRSRAEIVMPADESR